MTPAPRLQFFRVLGALMIREMITRYGRSWGGYFWAVAEPMAMITLLALVIGEFLVTPPIGKSFILFYATGYLPFHIFSEISSQTGTAVSVNRALMQLPSVRPLDAVLARFVLGLATMFLVALLLFAGILLFSEGALLYEPIHLVYAMLGAAVLGLGVGSVNVLLFAFFPTWKQIWGIVKAPLMIMSGVFYIFQSMPVAIQNILWWNPVVHIVGETRMAFYSTYDGAYISMLYVFAVGLGLSAVGFALNVRNRSFLIEVA